MLLHPTRTPSGSSKEQSEQPIESQLIRSLEAKGCTGRLKMYSKEICRPTGRSLGPEPETTAAIEALKESRISDCNLVDPSPPRAGKSQARTRRDLEA